MVIINLVRNPYLCVYSDEELNSVILGPLHVLYVNIIIVTIITTVLPFRPSLSLPSSLTVVSIVHHCCRYRPSSSSSSLLSFTVVPAVRRFCRCHCRRPSVLQVRDWGHCTWYLVATKACSLSVSCGVSVQILNTVSPFSRPDCQAT